MDLNFLICNDDGVTSLGTKILTEHLRKIGDVTVVLPDVERSAISHALSLHYPLRIKKLAKDFYAINGTPADCVRVGLWKNNKINIVISGINRGPNLGNDVIYSGTVAGAREGVIMGKPGIAISLAGDAEQGYKDASKWLIRILKNMQNIIFEKPMLLNINVPLKIKGVKFTTLGYRKYEEDIKIKLDPRGNEYHWLSSEIKKSKQHEESDVQAMREGYISICPLIINTFNHDVYRILKNKNLSFRI
jgi:5'-nucleotidase